MSHSGIPVHVKANNGQYFCAEGGGGGPVVANRDVPSDWETFGLNDLNGQDLVSGDVISLQAHNGKFVCAEGGGGQGVVANREVVAVWEKFNVTSPTGGRIGAGSRVNLRAANNEFVCAENDGGGPVNANRQVAAGWETFTLEKARRDGLLIMAPPNGTVYVMENGVRRGIPNPLTFNSHGYDWEQIWSIPEAEMATIPVGLPVPSVARFILDTGNQFLGAGHYMNTRAGFDTNTGLILATTKTWTGTWFGGFHGSVDVLLTDSDGLPVQVAMPSETYGVDGTAIGNSSITRAWEFQIDPLAAQKVALVTCFHSWSPDDFATILAKWKAAGETIDKLAAAASAVSKFATAIAA